MAVHTLVQGKVRKQQNNWEHKWQFLVCLFCQPVDQGVGQQILNRTYKDKNLCEKTNIYSSEKYRHHSY